MNSSTQHRLRSFLKCLQEEVETEAHIRVRCGAELEFYLCPAGRTLLPQRITSLRSDLLDAGLAIESVGVEAHPNQYEIAFSPQDEIVRLADDLWATRDIVRQHFSGCGLMPTFSAKPILEAPGSGLHIHISIHDQSGLNLFSKSEDQSSEPAMMQYAIEGLCQFMNESMQIFAPNDSSYVRFKFQPLAVEYRYSGAPTTVSWGGNNRTVALRIPDCAQSPKSRRLEHRVPGADANPYLVLAAIVASIGHGICSKSLLTHPKVWEDAIRFPDDYPRLVLSLPDARREFSESGVLRELLFPSRRHSFIELLNCDVVQD